MLVLFLQGVIVNADLVNVNPTTGEAKVFGMNPADAPSTPQDAANVSLTYLKQEWQKIVAKNPYIGPVHNFLLSHQSYITILFNVQYEFSLTFICIFILWCYIWFLSSDYISSFETLKLGLPWLAGLGVAVLFAQLGIIKFIVDAFLNLIFARSAWWARTLIWIAIIVIFFLIAYGEQLSVKARAKAKKEQAEQFVKEKAEQAWAYVKGAKEGQKIKDEFKK